MAFPASTQTKEQAWNSIRATANKLKTGVQSLRNQSASGNTGRSAYISLQKRIQDTLDMWASAAAVPGLEAYARDQITDPTLDLITEYVAMRDAATSLRDWIFDNLPRDVGTGAVLVWTVDNEGTQTELTVTSAQTSGFRTIADSFIATVG